MRFGKAGAIWGGVVAVTLLTSMALVAWARFSGPGVDESPQDSRAYSVDSGKISLEAGLERVGLEVPVCLNDGLRYALYYEGYEYYQDLYLRLSGSMDCMNDFLEMNELQDYLQKRRVGGATAERQLSHRPLWLDEAPIPEIGWRVGPEQKFQVFSVGRPAGYSVEVLMQRSQGLDSYSAYLYANRMH